MKPLLSNEDLEKLCSRWLPRLAQDWDVAWKMREIYEEDRRKKDELIQKLVDAVAYVTHHRYGDEDFRAMYYASGGVSLNTALAIADQMGYKPSER